MATMIVELYEALKAAGAPDDKAQAAAKVMAYSDERFASVDAKLAAVDARMGTMQVELVTVKAELAMVKWIVSGVGFGVLLLVLRSFWPGA
jgi:hypothetical protein